MIVFIASSVCFDGRFSKLQSGIDASIKSNQQLADGIQKLKITESIDQFEKSVTKRITESYKEIERNTKQIADDTRPAVADAFPARQAVARS